MSPLVRALRAGSASGPGGKKQQRVGEDNNDDDNDDVDLFGGKGRPSALGPTTVTMMTTSSQWIRTVTYPRVAKLQPAHRTALIHV